MSISYSQFATEDGQGGAESKHISFKISRLFIREPVNFSTNFSQFPREFVTVFKTAQDLNKIFSTSAKVSLKIPKLKLTKFFKISFEIILVKFLNKYLDYSLRISQIVQKICSVLSTNFSKNS